MTLYSLFHMFSVYVGKQMPQHSMQISRQSEDSQQASMIPQSMSQGQLQSSPRSSEQQQQQHASDVHVPQDACATTMLHRVRNSQNRQARMQCTQQSSGRGGLWEPVELPLLRRLLSLLTDRLERSFFCIFWDTEFEVGRGCSVMVEEWTIAVPCADAVLFWLMLAPQVHIFVPDAPFSLEWIPLPLLKVVVLFWLNLLWSLFSSS